jgi:hypothetical protein
VPSVVFLGVLCVKSRKAQLEMCALGKQFDGE